MADFQYGLNEYINNSNLLLSSNEIRNTVDIGNKSVARQYITIRRRTGEFVNLQERQRNMIINAREGKINNISLMDLDTAIIDKAVNNAIEEDVWEGDIWNN